MSRFIFWLVLKRLWNERWLAGALLLGMVVAVALVGSVTIYADGSMERLLADRWDPGPVGQAGAVLVRHLEDPARPTAPAQYAAVTQYLADAPAKVRLPAQYASVGGALDTSVLIPEGGTATTDKYGSITYLSTLADHITVVDGALPQGGLTEDHVVEALVDTATRDQLDLTVGRTYRYRAGTKPTSPDLLVRVVGAFKPNDARTPYWPYRPPFAGSLFVTQDAWEALLKADQFKIAEFNWYWLTDHERIKAGRSDQIIANLERMDSRVAQLMPDTRLEVSPLQVLRGFALLGGDLRLLLLLLAIPVVGLVLFFTVMASGMIASQSAAEVAVIKSRGGSTLQVVLIYLLQSLVLGVVALAIGVPLGLFGAKLIGASAGFLEFVSRRPLPVEVSPRTFAYAGATLAAAILAGTVPVALQARQSIVSYKAQRARRTRPPLFYRFGLDLVLLAFSVWAYRFLVGKQGASGAASVDLLVDPVLYFAPVLFILACALVAIRLFPLFTRALAWLARRGRGVVAHTAVSRIARSPHEYTSILSLLILTVAIGIYSGAAASTLDRNFLDRERYSTGADLVVSQLWTMSSTGGGPTPAPADADATGLAEPPRSTFEKLPGVVDGARVYTLTTQASVAGKGVGAVKAMLIDPAHFSQVAYFRPDFAPYQINAYMNNLLQYRDGALISAQAAKLAGLQLGDRFSAQIRGQTVSLRVVGIVDYWPTFYPPDDVFGVINLDFIQDTVGLMPYEWWFRMAPGARVTPVVETLRERGVAVTKAVDTRSRINEKRQEPQRTGLYGQLSLGFLVAVLVTMLGYLLHTFVSLRARLLEIGVLRAMGLSVRQLVGILAVEQVLSVGIGLLGGTALGLLSGKLFLPFLQVTADAAGRVPPFLVVSRWADIAKIFDVLGFTLVVVLVLLSFFVARIKLAQAVKLGEES
jgi:putative ABC transport system permease protein